MTASSARSPLTCPERATRQPGQRHMAFAERAIEVTGGQRDRDSGRQPGLAQYGQEGDRSGKPAPGFLVTGEPVGHIARQDDVVELPGRQPGVPAASKTQDRQVPGQLLLHQTKIARPQGRPGRIRGCRSPISARHWAGPAISWKHTQRRLRARYLWICPIEGGAGAVDVSPCQAR